MALGGGGLGPFGLHQGCTLSQQVSMVEGKGIRGRVVAPYKKDEPKVGCELKHRGRLKRGGVKGGRDNQGKYETRVGSRSVFEL